MVEIWHIRQIQGQQKNILAQINMLTDNEIMKFFIPQISGLCIGNGHQLLGNSKAQFRMLPSMIFMLKPVICSYPKHIIQQGFLVNPKNYQNPWRDSLLSKIQENDGIWQKKVKTFRAGENNISTFPLSIIFLKVSNAAFLGFLFMLW